MQTFIVEGRLSAHRTEGKGSSSSVLWRTPDAHADRGAVSAEKYAERVRKGLPLTLNFQVAHGTPGPSKLWPTACAMEAATERMISSQQKPGSMHSVTLSDAVRMWSTPTMRDYKGSNSLQHLEQEGNHHQAQLANQVKLYPTPKAQSARGDGKPHGEGSPSLDVVVGGQLNPDWVEWLMGFPVGWTSLTECQESPRSESIVQTD